MKKILKFLVLVCVVFSQISSPIKVIADEIDANTSKIDEIEVLGNKDRENITVNISASNFTEEFEDLTTSSYIIYTSLTFKYVTGEEKSIYEYKLVDGAKLNNDEVSFEFTNFGYGYNGTYLVDTKVYDVSGSMLESNESEYLENVVIKNDLESLTSKQLEVVEDEIPYGITLEVDGSIISNSEVEGEYIATEGGIVSFDVNLNKGNLSDESIKGGYYKFVINNDVVLYPYNFNNELNFSELANGKYEISVYYINEEYEVEYKDTVIIQNDLSTFESYYEYFTNEDISLFNKVVSSSLLTKEEQEMIDTVDFDKMKMLVMLGSLDESVKGNYFFDEYNNEPINIIYKYDGMFQNGEIKLPLVEDILNELKAENYLNSFDISILNQDDTLANMTDYIKTGMKLKITYGDNTIYYNFVVSGDVDNGYVEGKEVNMMIDHILGTSPLTTLNQYALDVNNDKVIDLLDVSKTAGSIALNSWVNSSVEGTVSSSLELNDKTVIRQGDTFTVNYLLNNFKGNNLMINALEGVIDYDNTKLELVSISADSVLSEFNSYNFESAKYIFAGREILNKEGVVLTFEFKAKEAGSTTISVVDDKAAFDGSVISINNNSKLNINIDRSLSSNNDISEITSNVGYFDKKFNKDELSYNLYVDYTVNKITLSGKLADIYAKTDGFKEYSLTGDYTPISISVVAENGSTKVYTINVIKVYPKNTNNNLSNLQIEGHSINFDKDTLEYLINVSSDVDSLDITANAEAGTSRVNIYGNNSFKEGENIVRVVVTAEDGSEKTYTIKVNKEAKEETVSEDTEETTEGSQLEKTIIIILIILVVIGLIYLIMKPDEEETIITPNKPNKK